MVTRPTDVHLFPMPLALAVALNALVRITLVLLVTFRIPLLEPSHQQVTETLEQRAEVPFQSWRVTMVPFQTILCPVDFSKCAREAFHVASSLAMVHGARLVVVHVIDVEYGKHSFGGVMVEVRPADYPQQQMQVLKRLKPPFPDIPLQHVLTEGRPAEAILKTAKEVQCDLIVMGTHGLTGFKRLLLGSVAEQVLRHAPCPVITVRQPSGSEE